MTAAPVAAAPAFTSPPFTEPGIAAPAVVSPTPAETDALTLDYGTRREHLVWGGLLVLWVLSLLISAAVVLLDGPLVVTFIPVIGGLVAIAASIVTGRTAGRKVGGAALGFAAAVSLFIPFYVGGAASLPLILLAWMVSTRRSGLVATAIPLIGGIGYLQLLIPASTFGYDWPLQFAAGVLFELVGIVVGVAFALWMDRIRARPRALADARAAERRASAPPPTGDATRTNTLAVLSLVLSLVGMSVVAIVLGHVAHSQLRRTGEQGKGLATAGLVIGYISLAASITIAVLAVTTSLFAAFNSSSYYY